jgi:uncharacterized protein YciI
MLYVIRFFDKPDMLAVREQLLPVHLAWLDERQSSILVAGALRIEAGATPVGALWIVEANSSEEVEASFQTDPFWLSGLRQSFEILQWSKAFPDRNAMI